MQPCYTLGPDVLIVAKEQPGERNLQDRDGRKIVGKV